MSSVSSMKLSDRLDKQSFDIDIAIIGAGVHALTLTLHLLQKRQDLREKILVFDPSGDWLT
ncbi:MAG: FAD/NAD(P)-binding protein, partial [Pseudanabaena sp.]